MKCSKFIENIYKFFFYFQAKAVFCLFWISLQRVSSLQDGEVVAVDSDVDFERLENEYAVGNVSAVTEAYENTTSSQIVTSILPETLTIDSNNATEFRPSVHLGEINEFRSPNTGNPFNKLNHLKFDNYFSAKGAAAATAWNNVPPKNDDKKVHQTINFFPTTSITDENQYLRTNGNNGATFPRVMPSLQSQNLNPTSFQNSLSSERPKFSSYLPEKTYFDSTYLQEPSPPPFEYPGFGSFQEEANFVTPLNDVRNFDFTNRPSFENNEEPNFVQGHQEIQEVSPTRNHRFPYKFYHETQTFHDGNLEYVAGEQVSNILPRARKYVSIIDIASHFFFFIINQWKQE